MCCRKNQCARAVPAARSNYGADYNRTTCGPRRGPRREGLVRMIVRAITQRREAKRAEIMANEAAMVKDPSTKLGYQDALSSHEKEVKSEEREQERTSVETNVYSPDLIRGPPPSYELVQRSVMV